MIYSVFQHKRYALRESLSLLLEKLRPNASRRFSTLKQSLFERPTLGDESQIAYLFRQSLKVTRSLLAKNRLHNSRFEQRRKSLERAALVKRYCDNFKIPQREDYLDLLRKDERSRILVSFHCGDYLYGSASLLSLESNKRDKYVLSLNRNSSASFSNLATGFSGKKLGSECELLLAETSTSKLSQILRRGNSSILLFCDIPPGLNETTEVNFLNRRARFSVGPAILALTNRVPLLPFINYSTESSSYLALAKQIEPILYPSETLRNGAKRITQNLVSFFEQIFLKNPEQWRFFSLLPCYFPRSNTEEVLGTRNVRIESY